MIRIAIAEDNIFSLKALEEKLALHADIKVTHTSENGAALLSKLAENSNVEVVFLDIEMPVLNGIETAEKVRKLYPHIKIIMITIFDNDEYIFNAIKAGADSYILKETNAEKIYETITDTLRGGAVMSPSIALKTLQLLKNATLPSPDTCHEKITLSDRETDILEQVSKGLPNRKIAENLFISPFTVKRHIENIYQKLHIHNRVELIEKARKSGLI